MYKNKNEKFPKVVQKPWGKEVWLELNDRYCYKRIYINAGTRTSFQFHAKKIETNYIIDGEAEVWLENEEGVVEKTLMKKDDFFNVQPPKKHRVIAITDLILQEVSTPEVDDVVRIEDDTNRSDGRITEEHTK
ncbi:cupin [Patescibacteria group bacterium]